MLGIVNYGVGNLRSVAAALQHVSVEDARVIDPADSLQGFMGIVIPGVGAFSTGSARLRIPAFNESVARFLESGGKVLGICLGMQLLFEWGVEGERSAGLGLIPGSVEPLRLQRGIRLPNMGWRPITQQQKHPIFTDIEPGAAFYFCHSYQAIATDDTCAVAVTRYGEDLVTAAVARNSILGVQFHPEKSGQNGLTLLRNFYRWCKE